MIQELFRIGPLSISPFGVILVAAFLAAYFQLRWGMKRLGVGDEEDGERLVFAGGVGGIVGAKIYYAILNRDWRLLFDRSGLVWYGGFVLGAAACSGRCAAAGCRGWPTADGPRRRWPSATRMGRIGCFLVGDDYGRPTDLPWGVAFPVGLPPTTAGNLRRDVRRRRSAGIVADTTLCASIRRSSTRRRWRWPSGCVGIWMLRRRVRAGHGAHGRRAARRRALPGRDPARQGRPILRPVDPGAGDQPRRCWWSSSRSGCRRRRRRLRAATEAR